MVSLSSFVSFAAVIERDCIRLEEHRRLLLTLVAFWLWRRTAGIGAVNAWDTARSAKRANKEKSRSFIPQLSTSTREARSKAFVHVRVV
mmetsp:Transcript_46772/g.93690  ORF Transcript_46772/g.93690 Transcript_46772/m.93690 type:complete len:89 (-) Transcript_46772:7-273(-)